MKEGTGEAKLNQFMKSLRKQFQADPADSASEEINLPEKSPMQAGDALDNLKKQQQEISEADRKIKKAREIHNQERERYPDHKETLSPKQQRRKIKKEQDDIQEEYKSIREQYREEHQKLRRRFKGSEDSFHPVSP